MGYFVFVGILFVVTAIVLIGLYSASAEATTDARGNTKGTGFKPGGWMFLAAFIAVAVFLLGTGCATADKVENGHVGIKKQFGAIVGEPTGDGLVFHAPWQSIDPVSVQNEKRTYKMGDKGINTGNVHVDVTGGSAVSRDSQAISLFVQVNYSLQKDKVVALYRQTGGHFLERILDNAVFQHSKAETAGFAATEFAANRETVRQNIETALARAVVDNGIIIQGVSLLDVGYSAELAAAIERTVTANQDALAAQAKVKIVTAEAEQRVAQAKGQASATLTQARADAESQRLKQRTLTPLLVQMAAIDKLQDNVQVIVCSVKGPCIPQAVLSTAGSGR